MATGMKPASACLLKRDIHAMLHPLGNLGLPVKNYSRAFLLLDAPPSKKNKLLGLNSGEFSLFKMWVSVCSGTDDTLPISCPSEEMTSA